MSTLPAATKWLSSSARQLPGQLCHVTEIWWRVGMANPVLGCVLGQWEVLRRPADSGLTLPRLLLSAVAITLEFTFCVFMVVNWWGGWCRWTFWSSKERVKTHILPLARKRCVRPHR